MAAEKALSSLGLEGAELSVLITGDRKMRALNRQYRGMDKTTDVLSFSVSGAKVAGPGPPPVLGDIAISATMAEAQATRIGHSTQDELMFLIVHGILHLSGYDHEGPEVKRRRMEARQRELMAVLKAL